MKEVIFVLFACFLGAASACFDRSDCGFAESCCSDYVCRVTCFSCDYDYECGSGECCDSSSGDCYNCITTAGIAGIVIGTLVIVAIVVSIVACCCCACCPYYRYRYRQPGTVIVQGTPYQPFGSTTTTQHSVHQQPPMGYNPAQPPPYYPQPQGGPYPPPQAQGMYPPPQATTGQPIKQ